MNIKWVKSIKYIEINILLCSMLFSHLLTNAQLDAKKYAVVSTDNGLNVEMYFEKPKTVCSNREWKYKLKFINIPLDASSKYLTWKFRTINCDDYIVENVISISLREYRAGLDLIGNTDWGISAKSIESGVYDIRVQSFHSTDKSRMLAKAFGSSNESRQSILKRDEPSLNGVPVDTLKANLSLLILDVKSIQIGRQIWMTENLNVERFRNGDLIPEAKTIEDWENASKNGRPAWCYYMNMPENGMKYGKLYNWYAVNDTRGLAPDGWHIPTEREWDEINYYLGNNYFAGKKMKNTKGWASDGNGDNSSGFSANPGGYRTDFGVFTNLLTHGYWWSSEEKNTLYGRTRFLNYKESYFYKDIAFKGQGFSVRCIRDENYSSKSSSISKSSNVIRGEINVGRDVWMDGNLNVERFRNGDIIPEAKTKDEWENAGKNKKPAWCYYNNVSIYDDEYGKLYNWYAVSDPRGLAPIGWHISTETEWNNLIQTLSTSYVAYYMKSKIGWNNSKNGNNSSGFNARPGGNRYYDGVFYLIGQRGFWWLSNKSEFDNVSVMYLDADASYPLKTLTSRENGYSVRCVRD